VRGARMRARAAERASARRRSAPLAIIIIGREANVSAGKYLSRLVRGR